MEDKSTQLEFVRKNQYIAFSDESDAYRVTFGLINPTLGQRTTGHDISLDLAGMDLLSGALLGHSFFVRGGLFTLRLDAGYLTIGIDRDPAKSASRVLSVGLYQQEKNQSVSLLLSPAEAYKLAKHCEHARLWHYLRPRLGAFLQSCATVRGEKS